MRLRVTTGSELAEVFLVDRTFALVQRAIGDLDCTVPQGVYKVKARVGDVATEDWHVLNADQAIDLSDELAIGSPVPLAGTTKTHEYHMQPAEEQSRKVVETGGTGAQIFLCARGWSDGWSDAAGSAPGRNEAPPLSLHRSDGTTVVDVREDESARGDGDPMLATAVQVDPGAYLVRWRDASGVVAEQTVVAVRDWQTQVFLLETQDRSDEDTQLENPLDGISVLMTRGGFTANDATLHITEQARLALASERKVASEVISQALFAKFENPMTGLFGAHLMLLAHETEREVEREQKRPSDAKRLWAPVAFDQTLFDIAVENLAGLLGLEHPDVTALATRASNRQLSQLAPVEMPPMLWRSWILLLEASNERPDLVPVATWQRTVRLLSARPFLVWSPVEDPAAVEAWKREVAPLVRASPAQQQGGGPDRAGAMGAPPPREEDTRRLSKQLLAPRAALDELAGTGLPG